LTGISRNIARDIAKARIKERQIPIQDCDSVTTDEQKQDEHVKVVRKIISGLPVKLKEVIFLRYYNQMSYQQISNMLGISQEAVNGRLRRAKKLIVKNFNRKTSTLCSRATAEDESIEVDL
jgi:RNA polymerase sigma factor (sigma-70 family)